MTSKNDDLQLISQLDSLFPDEELITTDWDTHWPHLIAFIKQYGIQERIDELDEVYALTNGEAWTDASGVPLTVNERIQQLTIIKGK